MKYPGIAEYWRERFGEKVWRIGVDAGFGCPNRDAETGRGGCIFCDPSSFALSDGDRRSISEQLAAGIERLRGKGVKKFAAYFQPRTNTFAPLAVLSKVWDEAASVEGVVALCIGTRPDCVGDEVLARLATHYAKLDVWLELGLQSANDRTLGRIGRGHDAAAFADAVRRAHAQGIMVAAHVILGLPDEDEADEARTADFLAALGVEGVKIHQLAVVAGTPLEEEYRAGMFKVLDEADYVRRAAAFVKRLPTTTVLHRLVGDTLGGRLVAPRFEKARVVRAIRERLST